MNNSEAVCVSDGAASEKRRGCSLVDVVATIGVFASVGGLLPAVLLGRGSDGVFEVLETTFVERE